LVLLGAFSWFEQAGTAHADEDAAVRPLTLAEAIDLALANSPDLRLSQAALEGAQADTVTAGEAPNPQLSLNSTAIGLRDGGGSGSLWTRTIDSVLRFDQPIELGGKRRFRLRAAREGERAAAADEEDVHRLVRENVASAYFALKYAQDGESVASAQLGLQQQSLDAARRRLRAGDIAPLDEVRWEIEVARSQSDLAAAQAARRSAQVDLAAAIGVSPRATTFSARDDWPPAELPVPIQGAEDRPDIRAAEARQERAEAAVRLAKAQQTRDVTVGLQLEHYPQPGSETNSFGVGFSIPLFIWHRYEGELRRAFADARTATENLRRQRVVAEAERGRAWADLEGAHTRLQHLQDDVLDKARLAAQAAEYAYRRGALGMTDLLDARRTLLAVRLDELAARAAFAKALTAWKAAVGSAAVPTAAAFTQITEGRERP
jgi:cobalt-zinc-cadmium efflux system outer membrane protein